MAGMKKRHSSRDLTQAEMDDLTIADANDPSAWGDSIRVGASESAKPRWVTEARRRSSLEPSESIEVESSIITRIGYNASTKTLHVEFRSGRIYQYFDVPEKEYEDLKNASSAGSYFSRAIRPKYPSAEVVFDCRVN